MSANQIFLSQNILTITDFVCKILYENFLHENCYIRSNYSSRAVIHVIMKIFCTKIFYHEIFKLHEINELCYNYFTIFAVHVFLKDCSLSHTILLY